MRTVAATVQDAYRRKLKRSHAMRRGLWQGVFRHRRWIWRTRLFRLSHGRLGRSPAEPPRPSRA